MADMSDTQAGAQPPLLKAKDIIKAAASLDLENIEKLLESSKFEDCKAVDVQDPATGYSPLHAAIASCADTVNGTAMSHESLSAREDRGAQMVRLLLENGAIWNQLDKNDETPGCVAYRLRLEGLYQLMVDAGVRAEMLLNRLDEYEQLQDDEDAATGDQGVEQAEGVAPAVVVTDASSEGAVETSREVNPTDYLASRLSFGTARLLDEQRNGVMMDWESKMMKQSADTLLHSPGLRFLNIGFGMGIIDSYVASHENRPCEHHIVEVHPEVLAEMRSRGWFDKDHVVVHEGKWQDILPKLANEGMTFDAIYYDTFAESYHDFKEFFSEHVLGLLDETGHWSFFNGMGADRQISYDVYQKIVEIDLFEAGFDVEWSDMDLPDLSREWDGVKRKYWNVDKYRLPTCKFMD